MRTPFVLMLAFAACDDAASSAVDATVTSDSPDTVVRDSAESDTGAVADTDAVADTGVVADTGADAVADTGAGADAEIVEPIVWDLAIEAVECRGVPHDTITVINTGDVDLALAGFSVSDSATRDDHRVALTGTLAPDAELVVSLVDFGLDCSSESAFLLHGDDVVDSMAADDTTDPSDTLYDPLATPAEVALTLSDDAVAALTADAYTWVDGTLTYSDAHGSDTLAVSVRLKGAQGSLRLLDGKAAFKIDFNRTDPEATFRGVRALTLNNMLQDGTKVREAMSYRVFRDVGVPAPRVGYVHVTVNGADFGLYASIEKPDKPWLKKHFTSSWAMFEGAYGQDLVPDDVDDLELDSGDEAAREAIRTAATVIAETPEGPGFKAALAPYVRWDEVVHMMATEVFVQHWDGYAPWRNNYYIHVDDNGQIALVPWGTDQAFGRYVPLFEGLGVLFTNCLADPECYDDYQDALLELAAVVKDDAWIHAWDALPGILQPYASSDPREGGGADVSGGYAGVQSSLAEVAGRASEAVSCSRNPDNDLDHDGWTCDRDCDEQAPNTYLRAPEICDDGIDQDCSDTADDGDACPVCSTRMHEGKRYLVCNGWNDYPSAVALCAAQGSRIAVVTAADNAWLGQELRNFGHLRAWIGLDKESGSFVWADGTPYADGFNAYYDGLENIPDGWNCMTYYAGDGDVWKVTHCDEVMPVVCKDP